VLDGLKGIVFDDDKNVYCSFAEKREAIDKNGLCVGIKMIKSEADYFDRYFPRCLVDDKIVESKDVWWLKFDDSKNPEIPS
jgi:hypothetical protein